MAKEYIEREAAIQYFKKRSKDFIGHEPIPPALVIMGCANEVDAIPSADVVPVVHARWAWNGTEGHWYCTNCFHNRFRDLEIGLDAAYCGSCGAKMDADMREVDDED